MSEMSRKDAAEYLREVKHAYRGYEKIPEAFDKVLSDMEKLKKIEEIVEEYKYRLFVQDVAFLKIKEILEE